MSVWEFIGWLIAIPMALFTGLFAYAFLVVVAKRIVKGPAKTVSKERHLRAVD